MKEMKKYRKPEIKVLSFVSGEAISAGSLDDWLSEYPDLQNDAGLTDAIQTYDVSSIM